MSIVDFFTASARRHPGRAAVRTATNLLTYAALDERSGKVCTVLRDHGIGPGARVAVSANNRPEFVELILGVAKAGASVVPIAVMDRAPQARHVLADSGASLVVYEAAMVDVAHAAADLEMAEIVLDDSSTVSGYESLVATASAASQTMWADGSTEMYVGYTSGSTGVPKGVVKSHQSLVSMGLAVGVEWGLRPGFTQLVTMPMCHSGGFWQVLFNLIHGGTIAIKPSTSFDPVEVLGLLEEWRVNWMVLVPTMSDALLAEAASVRSAFPDLSVMVSGSAPMFSSTKDGLLRLFRSAELNECYGATETGVVCNLSHKDQLRKTRSVGTPVVGVDIRVVDEDDQRVASGEVGEITARSPYTMEKYLGRPEETSAAVRPGGYVGVGDLATVDDDGYVFIVDRKQDMIITGGLNVYPAEVEEILKRQFGVIDAVVVGLPHERWGEQVTAAVVGDRNVDRDRLLEGCRAALARYKVPKQVHLLDRLPTLVTGKNSRRLVRERLLAGRD